MKKRFLSCLIVLTMLISAVYVPVSASTGKLTSKSVSDVIKSKNANEVAYTQTGTAEHGQLKVPVTQFTVGTFAADTVNNDYYGAFSFKIKAAAGNSEKTKPTFSLILNNNLGASNKKENEVFVIDYTGYMRATSGFNNTTGLAFTNNTEYTIGLVLKKNQSVDFYVNGEFKGNNEFSKEFATDLANIKLLFNVTDGATYYVKDLTWSRYSDDSFIAECQQSVVEAGETVNITFSDIIADCDTSKIKLFDCARGTEVTGASSVLDNNTLKVTLPNSIAGGKEYRIELDGVKGALGNTLANDNIYISIPSKTTTEEYIVYETFEGYTTKHRPAWEKAAGTTNYYKPEGWYLKQRWTTLVNGFIKPATDNNAAHGTVMQLGKINHDDGKFGAYLPFTEKITDGKIIISYDVKPEQLSERAATGSVQQNSSLFVMAYPEHPTNYNVDYSQAGDNSKIQEVDLSNPNTGRVISGIMGLKLGNPTTGNVTAWSADRNNWKTYHTFTEGVQSNADWYTMTAEFDFDTDTVTYYLNGTEKDSSTTLMETLGLNNGMSGISFGMWSYLKNTSLLIDNVSVKRVYNASLTDEVSIFSDDFNSFTSTGTPIVPPTGWGMAKINAATGTTVKAETGDDSTAALKLGKNIVDTTSQYDGPWVYHKLNNAYTTGVINVSYDLKAEALPALGSSIAKLNELGITNTNSLQQNFWPRSFYFSVDPSVITDTTQSPIKQSNAKHIFGIQNQQFAAYINNATSAVTLEDSNKYMYNANYRKAVTLNDTYAVKHSIDLDKGVVVTYIDGNVVSAASTETLGITTIGGICFGVDQYAYGTEVVIDNVNVTYQQYNTFAFSDAVMQVRFSDYYDNTYGAASTLTTLADTVAVAFWTDEIDTPQETNFALVDENGHVIPFRGSYSLADKTYIMNLNEYLTKDTEYTLTVSGLTVGGNPLPNYTQVINSAVQGEVIVEPMYIMQGSEKKSSGALANGDTVTAGTRVINTTGDIKTYSFFAALYDHGVLKMVDFAEVEQDGATSAEDKEANLSCSFTMSAEDAASITNIKAFLWDGFETLGPILPAIEFTNTAAAE